MKQELLGCEAVLEAVQQAAPAQVVGQVLGGHTTKTRHPGLQAGVITVDALNMLRPFAALAVMVRDKESGLHLQHLGHRSVAGIVVGAEHSICSQHWAQGLG